MTALRGVMGGSVRRIPRIPIRTKLAGSLALPLLALVAIGVVEVRQAASAVSQVRLETDLARAIGGPAGLVTRLQDERTFASVELVGIDGEYPVPMAGYPETRSATDEAIRTFRAEVDDTGGAVEATYREALASLDELEAIRQDIDATPRPRTLDNMRLATGVYDRYTVLVQGFLDANSHVASQVDDVELRAGTDLADLAGRQVELEASISRTTIVSAMLSPGGIDERSEVAAIATLLSAFQDNNLKIERAPGPYAAIVAEHYPADFVDQLSAKVEAAISSGTIADLRSWVDDVQSPGGGRYVGLRDAAIEGVVSRADALNADATSRQRLFAALAAAGVLVTAVITWLVSRSITRPLRSLTRQAKEMAEDRLPNAVLDILEAPLGEDVHVPQVQPVAVRTRDEVADVSAALNTVQESALDLAVEQAVLRRNIADSFVNLGRRNQNLLGRQLDFITELESDETDPDTLASLFRLDHLATRMRRNAESLLVLAGVDPPRTWAAPVRLTDAVRAAVSEVESYRRVRVEDVGPVMIVGAVAADLAHLLAELIENALTFSRPQDEVVVRGWHAGAAGVRLLVIDRGLGMSGPALDQANRRLSHAESFTVAPSKYLGHYVAGNLAARHGIRIRLEAGTSGGTVATVDLPPHLVAGEEAASASASAPTGGAAWPSPSPMPGPQDAGWPAAGS
jgi:signal transduction histidine kinase